MMLRYSSDSIRDLLLNSLVRKSLDERPEAAEWIKELAAAFRNDLGILALHGKSGLAEQLLGRPLVRVPLCGADNLILLLARSAIQSRQHLGIAVPPGTVMIPMLIVCKTLLGDLLDQQEMLGNINRSLDIKERGGILLVSPDAEMRVRYFSMRVGLESVVKSYPACRMRPDGSVTAVFAKDARLDQFSVCFFLAHQKQLPEPDCIAFKPDVVILDLTHDHWIDRLSAVIEWCTRLQDNQGNQATIIALLPFGDKLSRDALNIHNIPIFPLDSTGMLEIVNGFSPISPPTDEPTREAYRAWSFGAYALEEPQKRKHTIYLVPNEKSADILETTTYIYQALDSVNDKYVHPDLRLASWLVGTLIQLPIPIQWYEQHAYLMGNRQTLKKLISSIGNNGGTLHLAIAPVLQSLRGQLDLLYTRLSSTNPKSEAFLQYYKEHLQPSLTENKNTALLVRNDVVARAVWPWLLSEGIVTEQQCQLRILTYRQIDGREMFDHMIAVGSWPGRYRWQIGGRLGHMMDFLLYSGEEVILEQQMRPFYSFRAKAFNEKMRFSVLQKFIDIRTVPEPGQKYAGQSSLNLTTAGDKDRTQEPSQQTTIFDENFENADADLKSLFDLVSLDPTNYVSTSSSNIANTRGTPKTHLRHWSDDSFQDSGDQPESNEDGKYIPISGLTEPCLLLKIQTARANATADTPQYLYLNSDGTTECYIPGQNDADLNQVANDEIEPGFILIRTDQEDRQTLFDRIVQLADGQPTMKYLRVWREYWLEAIHNLAQKHASGRTKRGTYLGIQLQLAQTGVHVTQVTIRDWVLGERIGPGAIGSIQAVGALSQHPMVQQYPHQVDEAFKQIRKIHQVLGRRISNTLQKLGKTAKPKKGVPSSKATRQEIQLDPALSVPIDDLLDMLQFWEVIEVDQGPWNVPLNRVGVVLPSAFYGES